ncbi:unnamed protein product, partial [Staurois parvus]
MYGKSRRCRLGHVISCGTDDQCALIISVAPAVPPVRAHQCQLSLPINATCQCPSVSHECHISVPRVDINATYQCPSELPFSVTYQCHLSMPISATYQCQSVPPLSAGQ